MVITSTGDDAAATTVTGKFDQAALVGLIRRLYYLGYALISIQCIDPEIVDQIPPSQPANSEKLPPDISSVEE